jgi:hypothetical protein
METKTNKAPSEHFYNRKTMIIEMFWWCFVCLCFHDFPIIEMFWWCFVCLCFHGFPIIEMIWWCFVCLCFQIGNRVPSQQSE